MKAAPALLAAFLALSPPSSGQKMENPAGEAPGPWILGPQPYQARNGAGSPEAEMPPGSQMAVKGFAIKVGEHGEAAVAYDLDLCRMVGAWTGKFTTPMNLRSRGEYPAALGEVVFTTGEVAGFQLEGRAPARPTTRAGAKVENGRQATNPQPPSPAAESGTRGSAFLRWQGPRPEPFGPLPPGQARLRGFYVKGDKTILKWDIGGVEVLEMPGYEVAKGQHVFVRTFSFPPTEREIRICVAEEEEDNSTRGGGSYGTSQIEGKTVHQFLDAVSVDIKGRAWVGANVVATGNADDWSWLNGTHFELRERATDLVLPPLRERTAIAIRICYSTAAPGTALIPQVLPESVKALAVGGPARWPEPVVTNGELSKDTESAYVVDSVKLPDPNPWGAPMFVGGFDFFEKGKRPAGADGAIVGQAPRLPRAGEVPALQTGPPRCRAA